LKPDAFRGGDGDWHRVDRGGGELVSVATSALAIVAADPGFTGVAVILLALAICLYAR
jgi:hypothetical protein